MASTTFVITEELRQQLRYYASFQQRSVALRQLVAFGVCKPSLALALFSDDALTGCRSTSVPRGNAAKCPMAARGAAGAIGPACTRARGSATGPVVDPCDPEGGRVVRAVVLRVGIIARRQVLRPAQVPGADDDCRRGCICHSAATALAVDLAQFCNAGPESQLCPNHRQDQEQARLCRQPDLYHT